MQTSMYTHYQRHQYIYSIQTIIEVSLQRLSRFQVLIFFLLKFHMKPLSEPVLTQTAEAMPIASLGLSEFISCHGYSCSIPNHLLANACSMPRLRCHAHPRQRETHFASIWISTFSGESLRHFPRGWNRSPRKCSHRNDLNGVCDPIPFSIECWHSEGYVMVK